MYGTIGRAVRCEEHHELKRAADVAAYKRDPTVRAMRNKRLKKLYHTPGNTYADRKRASHRKWAAKQRRKRT